MTNGNWKGQVYHLSTERPGYVQVSVKNQITFDSESEAQAAGYRKVGNCKQMLFFDNWPRGTKAASN